MSCPAKCARGPRLPVAGDRRVDDARVDRRDRVVVHAQRGDDTGPEAFDDHVGVLRQRQERVAAPRVLEVERDAALVAIHGAVEGRDGSRPVAEVARIVAGAGVLDLDHVGAEVGEIERADRARQQPRQVEHADALERGGGVRGSPRGGGLALKDLVRARDAEIALDRARGRERLVERRREAGDVPHLAAAPRLGLAVEVELRRGMDEHARPVGLARGGAGSREPDVAQQVHHHRGLVLPGVAERQAGEHARLLLELRGHAGVDRVVAAVVRPRRDLVDDEPALRRHEHLDAQHAAVVELRRDGGRRRRAPRPPARRARAPGRSTRRGCRRDG